MIERHLIEEVLNQLKNPKREFRKEKSRKYLSLKKIEDIIDETIEHLHKKRDTISHNYIKAHKKRLAYNLSLIPVADDENQKILDVGCFGYVGLWLTRHFGYADVDGIQLKRDVPDSIINQKLQVGKQSYIQKRYNFDLESPNWPVEDTYDCIICWEVLEHINNDPMNVLEHINHLIKNNGLLYITVPNSISYKTFQEAMLGMPPWTYHFFEPDIDEPRHCFEYTPLVFRSLVKCAGFIETHFETIYAYAEPEQQEEPISIGTMLGFPSHLLGETLIIHGVKHTNTIPVKRPCVLYNQSEYYEHIYPVIIDHFYNYRHEHIGKSLQKIRRFDEVEEELKDTRKWLDTAYVERDSAWNDLHEARNQMESASHELVASKSRVETVSNEVGVLRNQLKAANREVGSSQSEIEFSKRKLESIRTKLLDSEHELASNQAQLASSEKNLAMARKELADFRSDHAKVQQQLESVLEKLAESREERAKVQQQLDSSLMKLSESHEERSRVQEKLESSMKKLSESREERSRVQEQLESALEKLAESREERSKVQEQLESVLEKLAESREDRAKVKQQLESALEESDESREERSRIQGQLESALEKLVESREERARVKKALESAHAENFWIRENLKSKKKSLRNVFSTLHDYHSKKKSLEKELVDTCSELSIIRGELEKTQSFNYCLTVEIARCERNLGEAFELLRKFRVEIKEAGKC